MCLVDIDKECGYLCGCVVCMTIWYCLLEFKFNLMIWKCIYLSWMHVLCELSVLTVPKTSKLLVTDVVLGRTM